jgi:hypothetical protein
VRRDGSSLFGPEEQWQTFYRASASWRMAEERWWPLSGLVTEFKPRISRGHRPAAGRRSPTSTRRTTSTPRATW